MISLEDHSFSLRFNPAMCLERVCAFIIKKEFVESFKIGFFKTAHTHLEKCTIFYNTQKQETLVDNRVRWIDLSTI
jgi:hypothetical protein